MKKSVCVIGAGLAGGIVASELARKGHPVTLLEAGDRPSPYHPGDEIWEASRIQAPLTRGSGIGGTSNFWHGGLTVLDRSDVDGVSGQHDRTALPLTYDSLRSAYARAAGLLQSSQTFGLEDIERPMTQPLQGFDAQSRSFRLKGLLYPNHVFSTLSSIEDAERNHGLRVLRRAEATRLVIQGSGRVSHAESSSGPEGRTEKHAADIFVLSAGGLSSPKILLNSSIDHPRLSKLPIGQFLVDHPTGFVFKAKLRRRMDLRPLFGMKGSGYKIRYGFTLRPESLEATDYRNHILYLRPAVSMKDPIAYDALKRKLVGYRAGGLGLVDALSLLRHSDMLFDAANFRFGFSSSTRFVTGMVFAEQRPLSSNRIHLRPRGPRFGINWSISPGDIESLRAFLTLFFAQHAKVFESQMMFGDLHARLDSAGHYSGGCRMSVTSEQGVVDGNLRVHLLDNAYVVDGSVIPYSGHANTGLTIAALALRCVDAITAA